LAHRSLTQSADRHSSSLPGCVRPFEQLGPEPPRDCVARKRRYNFAEAPNYGPIVMTGCASSEFPLN
jgi:hypothetical protein